MAQTISLWGAVYNSVPSILLPKQGGGTAQFDDTTISSNAAAASDITNGKKAVVNGVTITGTSVFSTIYTGGSAPSSSTGVNGDIYLQV